MSKTFVYTSIQKEAYHSYPDAGKIINTYPCDGSYMDVSHLAHRHSHYFKIKVWVEVAHNNRDIEFIQLRRWLDTLPAGNPMDFGNQSCEMIAENVGAILQERYPYSEIKVEVAEDEINGAIVEFEPLRKVNAV